MTSETEIIIEDYMCTRPIHAPDVCGNALLEMHRRIAN